MSLSIKLGNFLFRNAFFLYKPMYYMFKNRIDAYEIKLLKQHIKPGDVVLDIGANIGYYAEILSSVVGVNGKVHCFEPDANNFSHLQKATQKSANIQINNVAVGPATEKLNIYLSDELNVDHRTYQPEHYVKKLEVDAISIDDYISKNNLQKVNFVKMDIQGFEMQAIKGMQKLLEDKDVKMISEFWPYGLRTSGSSATDYFKYLTSLGFNCYLLEKNGLKLLTAQIVKELEPLGKEHYYNIFVTRAHV